MRALTGTTSETDGLSLRSHIVTRKLLRLCTNFPGRPKCECFLTHGPCTGGGAQPCRASGGALAGAAAAAAVAGAMTVAEARGLAGL